MSQRGLTYIEVLIVLGIMSVFMLVATPSIVKSLSVARQKATELELSNLDVVLGLFATVHQGRFPDTLGILVEEGYIRDRKGLTDGFGRPYLYRPDMDGNGYLLHSSGQDGKSGTRDDLVSPGSSGGFE